MHIALTILVVIEVVIAILCEVKLANEIEDLKSQLSQVEELLLTSTITDYDAKEVPQDEHDDPWHRD